ncbi:kinase-like domain-containing protein [Glomus cerebriforme]|uniref:Kinase-like domain-containing protein n=1 Tax=Glomus cerebriforme TaxID=658196 RepID=A0A397SHD7_9GLOM|nr:kinase-like domain-containing protein [Glomus cerebriforme]
MTSGIEIIDNFILKIQENSSNSQYFEWIHYEQFENIKSISHGEISNIRTAKWINGPIIDRKEQKRSGPLNVVLKIFKLENNNSELSSILNQVHYHYICYNKSPNKFLPIYGITKDPSKNEFISIIKYAEGGDLHDYLNSNFSSLNWNKKLSILSSFLRDLKTIHEQGFIHKDIHSKNILLSKNKTSFREENLLIAYLPTSGLTRPMVPTGNKNEKEGIYGILPYIAPEVLKGKEYIQASDIYSVGIVMCELSTGEFPFKDTFKDNQQLDMNLAINICQGERPKLSDNAPNIFNEVVEMCWAQDPSVRPSINELENIVSEWCDRLAELFNEADKK